MNGQLPLLLGFFVLVLAGVAAAGYALVLRPASGTLSSGSTREMMADALRRLGEAVPSLRNDAAPLRARLSAAGYRWPSAAAMFNGIRWTAAAVFGVAAAWAAVLHGQTSGPLLAGLCGAGFGYVLPETILSSLIRARARRVRAALPAALDLIVLGLEAGQSLDQAIADTARELRHAHPDLSTELAIVQFEMQIGKSRAEALQNMAERNNEAELRRLVSLIIESARFGTSAAPALSADARHLRTRMRQQANEQARKLGVKLVFPVFFLIMPSLLLVTLGPAVILVLQHLDQLVGIID